MHVKTSSNVSKLNRVGFVDSSQVMRHEFLYKPKTKRLSRQQESPTLSRLEKARQSKIKVKVLLMTFFDVGGIVHSEFLSQGQTINQQIYEGFLRRMLRLVREKRREFFRRIDRGRFIMTMHPAVFAERNITRLKKNSLFT